MGEKAMSPHNETLSEVPQLREDECARLLRSARQAITAAVKGQELPQPPDPGGRLSAPAGVFVSLHKAGLLRGCIGQVAAPRPLYRGVLEAAASAALRDPRFPPLRQHELADVEIEISVLSPMVEIQAVQAESLMVIGRHGLMVSQGPFRGLLLPQVATHLGWGAREFLEETCVKAGLPRQAWSCGARLEIFSAQVFSESTPPGSYSSST